MERFKEKLILDVRHKLYEIFGATLEQFLQGIRLSTTEFEKNIIADIEYGGIAYARSNVYWSINCLSCIIQERTLDRKMTLDEVEENARIYGL